MDTLKNIETVYMSAKNSKLETSYFESIEKELNQLSEYFKVSKNQSFIIAVVYELNLKNNSVSFEILSAYFNCHSQKIINYRSDFLELYSRGVFYENQLLQSQFMVDEIVAYTILNNKQMPNTE